MQNLARISRKACSPSNAALVNRLTVQRRFLTPSDPADSLHRSDGSLPRRDPSQSHSFPKRDPENPYRSLCKLTLIGRTGTPPEVREFDDGSSSLTLSVATNHNAGSMDDWKIETQWHKIFVSGNVTGFSIMRDLAVGSMVYVEGNMRISTVERDGETRQYVNVRVNRGEGIVRILSSPRRQDDLPF